MKILGTAPTAAEDIATKAYVDSVGGGTTTRIGDLSVIAAPTLLPTDIAPVVDVSADETMQTTIHDLAAALTFEIEVDFGSTPVHSKSFTITDAFVSSTTKIIAVQSGNTATGRGSGLDDEWDGLACSCTPASGTFRLAITAIPGPVQGKRKILYTIA